MHWGSMPRRPHAVPDGTKTRLAVVSGAFEEAALGALPYWNGHRTSGGHCRDQGHGMPFAVLNTLADKRELLAGEGRQRRLRR
jgi:hypothetical protein